MKINNFIGILNNKWITPIVTIITGVYAIVFGFYFNKLDVQERKLKQIETSMNTKLREKEFINNLRLTLYQEVKQSMKTNDTVQQKITLLLIDELLKEDTGFRDKLITLVLSRTQSPTLVKEQNEIISFNETESHVKGKWNINVFWLEDIPEESLPRAEKAVKLIQAKYPDVNVRLRKLSKTVNSKQGYRISRNVVRAELHEIKFASKITGLLNNSNVFQNEKLFIAPSSTKSNYSFSIFIRNM